MVFLEGGLQWIFDGGFDRRNSAKGGARVKWNFAWTIRQFFSSYAYDVNGGIRLLRYHKMIKIWIPLSPCSYLFDFGNPLLLPRTFKTLHQPTTPYKKQWIVWFYSFKTICCNQDLLPECHKKCFPDLNVFQVPPNANAINYWYIDWVNYSKDLDLRQAEKILQDTRCPFHHLPRCPPIV